VTNPSASATGQPDQSTKGLDGKDIIFMIIATFAQAIWASAMA
jgi:hypothetical protein